MKEISGIYYSGEKDASHYVELKTNGEFLHFYKKGELELQNIGKWHFNREKCEVLFSRWKSYGDYQDKNCINGCSAFVKVKNETLLFSFDLKEMNFEK